MNLQQTRMKNMKIQNDFHTEMFKLFIEYINCLTNEAIKNQPDLFHFWDVIESYKNTARYQKQFDDCSPWLNKQIDTVNQEVRIEYEVLLKETMHSEVHKEVTELIECHNLVILDDTEEINRYSNSLAYLNNFKETYTLNQYAKLAIYKDQIIIPECMTDDKPILKEVINRKAKTFLH